MKRVIFCVLVQILFMASTAAIASAEQGLNARNLKKTDKVIASEREAKTGLELARPAAPAPQADDDRGCCVLKLGSDRTRKYSTTRKECKDTATSIPCPFSFYKDTQCEDVP